MARLIRQEDIDQFTAITGRSETDARHFLRNADGNLTNAILNSFDHPDPIIETPQQTYIPPHFRDSQQLLEPISPPQTKLKPKKRHRRIPDYLRNVFSRATKIFATREQIQSEIVRSRADFTDSQQSKSSDPPPLVKQHQASQKPHPILITFYSNGFSVNETKFIPKSHPSHSAHIESITKGCFPDELLPNQEIGDVFVMMYNKSEEEYHKSPESPPPYATEPISSIIERLYLKLQ
ncbi:hypothetical protein BLNAU_14307 [Blattamonas nauphoetae]|uniref:SEP domain-containing protein n=1 Tax=Blattamonas nauphoetae TaxID=2049346 RepID=A0ABQ9XHJ0_9EUKA|nr:hypothetical protein BLNAU_14307 [Blattamonas nauphoetae]